jgi:hypothetical protein
MSESINNLTEERMKAVVRELSSNGVFARDRSLLEDLMNELVMDDNLANLGEIAGEIHEALVSQGDFTAEEVRLLGNGVDMALICVAGLMDPARWERPEA